MSINTSAYYRPGPPPPPPPGAPPVPREIAIPELFIEVINIDREDLHPNAMVRIRNLITGLHNNYQMTEDVFQLVTVPIWILLTAPIWMPLISSVVRLW